MREALGLAEIPLVGQFMIVVGVGVGDVEVVGDGDVFEKTLT